MAARLQSGKLEWTGEHWVAMLRTPGTERDSAIVSHFVFRLSPVGEGNVAVVRIGDKQGFHAVCYDNGAIVPWALERFFANIAYFDPTLVHHRCTFIRGGEATHDPSWCIQTENGLRIEASWRVGEDPLVINTPWKNNFYVFSILNFAREASVSLDGQRIEGEPYSREIWRDSIGGDRSSCVFALSESFFLLLANKA